MDTFSTPTSFLLELDVKDTDTADEVESLARNVDVGLVV
jgi:hypothetical protein